MTVIDTSQFERRKTFEEVARIVLDDKATIDLPERSHVVFRDTLAHAQFNDFMEDTKQGELQRMSDAIFRATARGDGTLRSFYPATAMRQMTAQGSQTDKHASGKRTKKSKQVPPDETLDQYMRDPDDKGDGGDGDGGGIASVAMEQNRQRWT